jgi:DNA-directed RNA polymerase alpha subunit
MMARVVKALKRHVVPVFNPEHIPIGGKRKLKDAPCRTTLSSRVVRLPTRIRNAVKSAGLKTIGDLRETTDEAFANIPNLGPGVCQMAARSLARRSSNDVQRRAFGWPHPLCEVHGGRRGFIYLTSWLAF